MIKTLLNAIALVWLLATPAQAAPANGADITTPEHYTLVLPLGWHEVGQQNQPGRSLTAYAPAGQSDGSLSDLLTVETIPTTKTSLSLQATYNRMGSQYQSACNISNIGRLQMGRVNGYDSAFWVIGCGERPGTGRGEVAFVHVIQGVAALYVIERVWQTPLWHQEGPPVSAADAENARLMLKGFSVCDTGNPNHPCPAK